VIVLCLDSLYLAFLGANLLFRLIRNARDRGYIGASEKRVSTDFNKQLGKTMDYPEDGMGRGTAGIGSAAQRQLKWHGHHDMIREEYRRR